MPAKKPRIKPDELQPVNLTVRMTQRLYDALGDYASQDDCSMSQLMVLAIAEYIGYDIDRERSELEYYDGRRSTVPRFQSIEEEREYKRRAQAERRARLKQRAIDALRSELL